MEKHPSFEPNSTEHLIEKAERLEYEAFSEVTVRYGSGFPDDEMVPAIRNLAYHNLQHTWRVRDAAKQVANERGLSQYDTALVRLIAASHDVIHDSSQGKTAEELSAQLLIGKMKAAGFGKEDQEIARLALFGTTPLLDANNAYMGQQFILTEFPSVRAGEIALCVAAADMEAVFASHGPKVAHDLFKERSGIGCSQLPETLSGLIDFQVQQIQFIRDFKPLYPELEQFLGGLRQPIIQYHQKLLNDLVAHRITTWEEIEERDMHFMTAFQ